MDKRNNLKRKRLNKMVWFYPIEDTKHFEIFSTNLDDYYTLKETYDILGVEKYTLKSILKEEGMESFKLNSTLVYHSKENIKIIAEKMKEAKEKYCSPSELKSICGITFRQPKNIFTPIKSTAIIRFALGTQAENVFSLEEVQEYKNNIDIQDKTRRILLEGTPVEAFEKWLTMKKFLF